MNLSVLVLKTRYPSSSHPFAVVSVLERALGGFLWVWLGFGLTLGVNTLKFHDSTCIRHFLSSVHKRVCSYATLLACVLAC